MSTSDATARQGTLFGHPSGLFTLFFTEMWERFSFYGMRALLILYMIKGFLNCKDSDSYTIYGAYTALVYMTPFFGGMLADRLLGARRSVVLGAVLMALGQTLLMIPSPFVFYAGLGLLVSGNGFFKPNISTIIGGLYPAGSPKRDGGFTIFYMGINLGAAMSPLLCGYIGERFNWSLGFGLATIGMLFGLTVFIVPSRLAQILIAVGAATAAGGLFFIHPDNIFSIAINVFVGISLLAAAVVAWLALERGDVPRNLGLPPDPQRLHRPLLGPLSAQWVVLLGTVLATVVFVLLVSGFSLFTKDHRPVSLVPDATLKNLEGSSNQVVQVLAVVVKEMSRPAGLVLLIAGLLAFGYIGFETVRLERIPRQRMYVVLILTFFSMLFWSFFEQAGSSINNFTDRNVDRVFESRRITAEDVGKTIRIQPTQEQFGYKNGNEMFTLTTLNNLDEKHKGGTYEIDWKVSEDDVGMGIAKRSQEIPASTFQSINAVYIMIFGLVFSAMWTFLAQHRLEPSTPVKFALGLLQLGLGFGAFWYGAYTADARGMVGLSWLLLGYLLHTTGELCLSPVGLSMVTRLSPTRMISTIMGAWFLATAYSQFLAAIIAQFTRVDQGEGAAMVIPPPIETVHLYGDVFFKIGVSAVVSSVICFALAPVLTYWMHTGAPSNEEMEAA